MKIGRGEKGFDKQSIANWISLKLNFTESFEFLTPSKNSWYGIMHKVDPSPYTPHTPPHIPPSPHTVSRRKNFESKIWFKKGQKLANWSKVSKTMNFDPYFVEYLENTTFLLLCLLHRVLQHSEAEYGYISKMMKFCATKPFRMWVRIMDYMAKEAPSCA